MSSEREKWDWELLFQIFFASILLQCALSSDFPIQEGCSWTETCMHKWWGDCGGLVYNQSDDCHGICRGPKYSPCPPLHTRFFCCIAGSPKKIVNGCQRCEHKVDYGDELVCCSDCSYPDMIYSDTSSGYCKTGGELILQPKPREVFKWIAGRWLPCSSPCGGGLRSRTVECFAVIEDTSAPDYPVYDDHCSNETMPAKQEPCNLESCAKDKTDSPSGKQHGRIPAWLSTILIFVGVIALAALGFAGYIFYRRRISSDHGCVYIMLEGYS